MNDRVSDILKFLEEYLCNHTYDDKKVGIVSHSHILLLMTSNGKLDENLKPVDGKTFRNCDVYPWANPRLS